MILIAVTTTTATAITMTTAMVLVLVDLWLPTYIWHILSVDVVSTILLLNYRRPIDPERTTSEKQFVYVALQEK